MSVAKWLPLFGYVASILAANALIVFLGVVPVGFGLDGALLLAPAGVYAAGFAFTFRGLTQDALGRRWSIGGTTGAPNQRLGPLICHPTIGTEE